MTTVLFSPTFAIAAPFWALMILAPGWRLTTGDLRTGVSSAESGESPYAEWFAVPSSTAAAVRATRSEGRRVIAYAKALRTGYCWHEFGDVHLILPSG